MSEPRPTSGTSVTGDVDVAPDLTAILRRRWPIIVICALIGLALAYLFVAVRAPSYEARSTLLLIAADGEEAPSGGRARTVDIDTWATVARSTDLLRQVAADLDLELSAVQARTSATAAATGDILILASTAPTSARAVEGASVYSSRFLESRQATINADTRERRQQLEDLQTRLLEELDLLNDQIADAAAGGPDAGDLARLENEQQVTLDRVGGIAAEIDQLGTETEAGRIVIQPDTAVGRVGLGRSVVLLSGLLAGALIGFVLALLRDRYDDRYRSLAPSNHFGIEEIARVPAGDDDDPAVQQEYSRLLVRLAFSQQGSPETGRSVLLLPVDGDHLPPDAAELVASQLKAATRHSGVSAAVVRNSAKSAVKVGKRQNASGITVAMMKGLSTSDVVLLPRPPLDEIPSSIALATSVDVTVLLVSGDTKASRIEQAIEDLESVGPCEIKIAVLAPHAKQPRGVRRWWAGFIESGRAPAPE